MANVTEQQVVAALSHVIEPELHKDLITLNMIEDIQIDGSDVSFKVILTTPACPLKGQIEAESSAAVKGIPGVGNVTVHLDSRVPADAQLMGKMQIGVKNAIAVAAGKGGVGKSTVSTNLALSLALDGAKVGLLDADIYGPNIPLMMGVSGRPRAAGNNRILPPTGHGVKMISIGFLVDRKQPLIWRGPMLHSTIRQFLQDVEWGELDYLIIDLPPGTGDAALSLAQSMSLSGAVIVTTPQEVAVSDVIRSVGMFSQLNVPVFGVVENMSYFIAPDTGKQYDIFGSGGGKAMADEVELPFLGQIPLEIGVREGGDQGSPIVVRDPEAASAQAIRKISRDIAAMVSVRNMQDGASSEPSLSIVN